MNNKYYEKNNYEEFYNDCWTDTDNGCRKHCKDDCWADTDNGCRKHRKDDCCRERHMNDCCDMPNPCEDNRFERRPIRRCDEDAIEREIDNLFRFILNQLCNTEEDIDVIAKAFVQLAKLLVEDTCLESSEEQLICCVAKDIQALQILIDKTIRNVKCLRKDVKCC